MGPLATSNPAANPGPMGVGAPDQSAGGYSASSMVDEDQGAPDQDQEAQSNALSALVEMIRGMEDQLMTIAKSFPDAASDVRAATDAIRKVLQTVISSPGQAEPPSPRILG